MSALLSCIPLIAVAAATDATELLSRVMAAHAALHELRGTFTQRKGIASFSHELVSRGTFESRRGRFVWRYTHPDRFELLVEGDQASLTLEGAPPERIDLSRKPALRALLKIVELGGLAQEEQARLLEAYAVSSRKSKQGPVLLLAAKRNAKGPIARIQVTFDAATLLPRRVEVTEGSGDTLEIVFADLEVSPPRGPPAGSDKPGSQPR